MAVLHMARAERLIRIISGIILVFCGLLLSGFWRPASIAVGIFLLVTAFVGY